MEKSDSKLILGTVQFGLDYGVCNTSGMVGQNEVRKILNFAKNNNIQMLDTAFRYGDSEKTLGANNVKDFQIITKTSLLDEGVGSVISNFHTSLERLKLESVEGLMIHDIDDVYHPNFDNLYTELKSLQEDGLINRLGFSIYTPEQIDHILSYFDFELIQLPFNIFDSRLIKHGHLKNLKNRNIEIHARSIFLQGLLLDFESLPNYFKTWKVEFDTYQKLVRDSGFSLMDYALGYAINMKEIDYLVVGVNNSRQLEEVISSSKKVVDANRYDIEDINLLNPSLWETD